MEFQNKVVAITGAAGGIGRELCKHFGEQGAAIVALDRSETVTDFAEGLRTDGTIIEAAVVDIVDADAVRLVFARLDQPSRPRRHPDQQRRCVQEPEPGADDARRFQRRHQRESEWRLQLHARRAADMKARRSGAIVNIGSVNGLAALGDAAYSAGKAGLISLTQSLALEFGRYNIRANIVCPGTVRTPLWNDRCPATRRF